MEALETNVKAYEYTTFPRRFASYRWFKPILVALLTATFVFMFQVILLIFATIFSGDLNFISTIGEGYDDMNAFTGPGALVEIGGIAVLLPALALAALIVRDRPYSSYSSSRGGWNWSTFFKCLAVAIVVMAAFTVLQIALFPDDGTAAGEIRFTTVGLIACVVLVPIQCVAEEYVFRGLIMQTVGAWTKLPAIAIAVSALVFALGHPYNVTGMVTIFLNGVIWGTLVWHTKGLEATSALHIVNNLIAFGFAGFGLSEMTSEVDMISLFMDVATCLVFAAIIVFANRKYGWFTAKRDGTAAFNRKVHEKIARKQRKAGTLPEQPIAFEGLPPSMQERNVFIANSSV